MTPGSADPRVLRRHLLALRRAVDELRRHTGRPVEALDDWDELRVVERGLQLCAQNALDIATHLAAGAGRDVPDYASAIDVLADLGIISREFSSRFRSVAGFRNILVHGYLEVDRTILHRVLNTRLTEFTELVDLVEAHLESP
ncbi:MAG: DUF86 domain-containing protein [Thermoanaerobaculales bacterium]|jgi:uncharacterized protein YutE (UPF0331/DUF86 family)|nr:DUF86 domain-containing protein [Thermoanaerobaculales bacterium]